MFVTPVYPGQPIHRTAMGTALRGTKHEKNPDKSEKAGLYELLDLKPFRPHDLRRTCATLAGELGFSEAAIAVHPKWTGTRFRPLITDALPRSDLRLPV